MAAESKYDIQEQAIHRLLRCTQTHRYFTGTGWTNDPSQAKIYTSLDFHGQPFA